MALVYVALVFVRPLRACPKCHGERVLRKGRRARICPRCKGYGKTRRVGASMVHRMWWDARSERAKDGED